MKRLSYSLIIIGSYFWSVFFIRNFSFTFNETVPYHESNLSKIFNPVLDMENLQNETFTQFVHVNS